MGSLSAVARSCLCEGVVVVVELVLEEPSELFLWTAYGTGLLGGFRFSLARCTAAALAASMLSHDLMEFEMTEMVLLLLLKTLSS